MGDSFATALIGRSVGLPAGLLARFPELRAVRWRRGGLPVFVAGWFLGRRSAAAITLWNVVFLAPGVALDPELLLHELRHVHQFEASFVFPVVYLRESVRRGYFANRFEVDARAYAARRLRGAE
jgi:hypothetical protein